MRLPSTLLVLTLLSGAALADDEETLVFPHQGRLLDHDNQPVNGLVKMRFALYAHDRPPASSADATWWEGEEVDVLVEDGVYQVALGQLDSGTGSIPASAFGGEGERWLGVTIDGTPMLPRHRVGSVPYAWEARRALHAEQATLADRAILADHATLADEAEVAARADRATLAEQASVAEFATLSGIASLADGLSGGCVGCVFAGQIREGAVTREKLSLEGCDDGQVLTRRPGGWACELPPAWVATEGGGLGVDGLSVRITEGGVTAPMLAGGVVTDTSVAADAAIATTKLSGPVTGIVGHGLGALATKERVEAGDVAAGAITDEALVEGSYPTITGVGTLSSLEVARPVRVGAGGTCDLSRAGAIRFLAGAFEGCDGVAWQRFATPPRVVTRNLLLYLDASDPRSLPVPPGDATVLDGTQWNDLSGNGRHARIHSDGASMHVRTVHGGALDFGGKQATNYVEMDPALVHHRNVWTVELWVTPKGLSGIDTLFQSSASNHMTIYSNTTNWFFEMPSGSSTVAHGLTEDTPVHVAFVVTAADQPLAYYRNGAPAGTFDLPVATAIAAAPASFLLGQEQDCPGGCFDAAQSWGGQVHVVRLYGRALSAVELAANFALERARFGK